MLFIGERCWKAPASATISASGTPKMMPVPRRYLARDYYRSFLAEPISRRPALLFSQLFLITPGLVAILSDIHIEGLPGLDVSVPAAKRSRAASDLSTVARCSRSSAITALRSITSPLTVSACCDCPESIRFTKRRVESKELTELSTTSLARMP